ncbi:exodeoxyribonuclease VII small subunit [Thermodesulfobacteriota bacterium]
MKFEEAMKRLEDIVKNLEKGDLPLEDSIGSFEEGMKLINLCSKRLEEAEQKVNMLVKGSGDSVTLRPFEIEKEDES